MSQPLHVLKQEYRDLIFEIQESGGEWTPEIGERLRITRENFEDKVLAYHWIIKQLQANADMAAEEISRLSAIQAANKKQIEDMKERLKDALLLFGTTDKEGITRFSAGNVKLSTRRSESTNTQALMAAIDEYVAFFPPDVDLKTIPIMEADLMDIPLPDFTQNIEALHEFVKNFVVVKVQWSVSKEAVKAALKAGEPVFGTEIVSNVNLVIR